MILFIASVWVVLSGFIGNIEAMYYHVKTKAVVNIPDEHPILTAERVLMAIPFCIVMFNGTWLSCLNIFMLPLLFVLPHDGVYYSTRNNLDPTVYPKRFLDFSATSIAWSDKKKLTILPLRIAYFVVGVVGLILINR